jgi:hypothetical protein
MSTEIITTNPTAPMTFTRDQMELIKNTFCKGSTDDELQLFVAVARYMQSSDGITRQEGKS